MNTPSLNGIDHIHVYVDRWAEAEKWYGDVLGFTRVDKFMVWAVDSGPLTLGNPQGNVHIALFERPGHEDTSAIAFGASGEEFLDWKSHFEGKSLELRISDHELAFSMYFTDPWGNMHEITTYDHEYVRKRLADS